MDDPLHHNPDDIEVFRPGPRPHPHHASSHSTTAFFKRKGSALAIWLTLIIAVSGFAKSWFLVPHQITTLENAHKDLKVDYRELREALINVQTQLARMEQDLKDVRFYILREHNKP